MKYEQRNYGSKLQALATVKMLDELRLQYQIIRYKKDLWFYIKSLPRFLNWVFLNDRYDQIQRNIEYKKHPGVNQDIALRNEVFACFDEQLFAANLRVYESYGQLKRQCCRNYDSVLTCSDQLWSPSALGSGFYNLMFVPEDMRKVSWASSFGVSRIPWYQKRRTRTYLNRIQFVSMRENRGAQIVKELTGRDVPVLMDPVFVFDRERWNTLVPVCQPEWENYIFCYFLGDNPNYREKANELAEKTGLKIVTLPHLDRYVAGDETFGDIAPYDVDPYRFLNILRHAEYVCTDSFHGSAFSILFEKKFVVFDRYKSSSANSKNSRIDSLCRNLGLEDRRYADGANLLELLERPVDYAAVNERLSQYRQSTIHYLSDALGTSEGS